MHTTKENIEKRIWGIYDKEDVLVDILSDLLERIENIETVLMCGKDRGEV